MSKTLKFILAVLVGIALVLLVAPDAGAAKKAPRQARTLDLSGDVVYAPVQPSTWRWAVDTIHVYDDRAPSSLDRTKLPEAIAEWSLNSAANLAAVSVQDHAEIVVRYSDEPLCGGVLCAYMPPASNRVASGRCFVLISTSAARLSVAEYLMLHGIGHCLGLRDGGGVMASTVSTLRYPTAPTAENYGAMQALYGR